MAFETRSVVRGHTIGRGRGHGRGGHDSPPLTHVESHVQEENREESHRDDSKGTILRHMMRIIMEHLPPPQDVDNKELHHVGNEEMWRSKSPWGDLHMLEWGFHCTKIPIYQCLIQPLNL